MLTCYSAILLLLHEFALHGTVSPDSVLKMIRLTPTMRLEKLIQEPQCSAAHAAIATLLSRYHSFLRTTDLPEQELIRLFSTTESTRKYAEEAYKFGDSVADALAAIGNGKAQRFYRLLIV